jgi:hypothetical protein
VVRALVVAAALVALVVMTAHGPEEPPRADELRAAALRWIAEGTAAQPRRDDDGWEVDVARPDGSVVEVTVGEDLELLDLDEEAGPGGTSAPDELRGHERTVAARRAVAAAGPGAVLSVERDREGRSETEVGLRLRDGSVVEVGLDDELEVVEVAPEGPGDH